MRDGAEVSLAEARRIAVRAQLLDGAANGVLDTVRRLGFLQMDLEQALELRGAGGLGHLRQRFYELLFRVQDIAKLIDQELLDGLRFCEVGAFGMDRRALRQIVPDVLERRGLDELPLLALVPWAAGIDLALIALADVS